MAAIHRYCFAAAHVAVRDAYVDAEHRPDAPASPDALSQWINWEQTAAIRKRLDALGFGVAEAMDTAQRFSLGWTNARTLIDLCGALDLENGFIAGAGADQLERIDDTGALVAAVVEQAQYIQARRGIPIILPMPWLAARESSPLDYIVVYSEIIDKLEGPLFIHWLGEAFMPTLRGYFPEDSFFDVMAHAPEKVRGAKLSLLDAHFEEAARARLLEHDQIMFTGDDFNFGHLIEGDNETVRTTRMGQREIALGNFSHALLGVLDAIAAPASEALVYLRDGDEAAYREIMTRCEALGKWLFRQPTQHYKAGLAYLAWARDWQSNPMLLNHEERTRQYSYYERATELALKAGVLPDRGTADGKLEEMRRYLR